MTKPKFKLGNILDEWAYISTYVDVPDHNKYEIYICEVIDMSKPNLRNPFELNEWMEQTSRRITIASNVGGDPEMATARFADQLVDELLELYKSNTDMAYGYALSESELSKDEFQRAMWLSVCKVLDERLGLKKGDEQ